MPKSCSAARMRLCSASDLDIAKTLECGQCFRWNAGPDGVYAGVARGRAARVWEEAGTVYIDAPEEELGFWSEYFDLSTDYDMARASIASGRYLSECVNFGRGIRILRQEPWEALCSFIISQCNNIPRIKAITEKLCTLFGEKIAHCGETYYSFPAAERIAVLTEEALAPLHSGYRARYILSAARAVAAGDVALDAVSALPCDEARAELKKLPGVGDKVANCALLFGMHRMDVFPVDVWIKRVLKEQFGNDFRPDSLGPYAGLAQQYMFYYARCAAQKK
ncbi:MAG TPA: DNA-(apurinic or apyrimidinic site) lyase [Clostridiales bacterium]|jgi:N-glycosylase/DNA lyase|nr:DNA-(apurinic or apyrimidinic site) lyase [Clostridiales bacterium]HBR09505.1 DNA-(apurinic or apyrimidinic site) lyase [Clostridiales bacterium]